MPDCLRFRRYFRSVALALEVGLVLVTFALPAVAETPAEVRQFDFWVGEWEVTGPKGRVVGENRIEKVLGGRALQEHWTGNGGVVGTSLNIYDESAGKWRQFWVDGSGGVLRLEGGLVGTSMVLQGETRDGNGASVIERITWTPGADGTVRQLWEKSGDGGATWTTAFDGHYRRKSP